MKVSKDDTLIEKARKDIGESGVQKIQGPQGNGYDSMGKSGDKNVKSGQAFEKKDLNGPGGKMLDMSKKGSGGYNSTLPENTLIDNFGYDNFAKSGSGSV